MRDNMPIDTPLQQNEVGFAAALGLESVPALATRIC